GKNSLNRLIRCVCGKKIGPDPRNFNQRVSLGRNDLLIRTFPNKLQPGIYKNMGSNSVNIIINNTRKIIPPGKVFTLRGGTLNINIPGRSALLLGKTGEPPNYLYL
ncbi:hypothetical protein ACQ93O_05115, partial [Escherichia coli]